MPPTCLIGLLLAVVPQAPAAGPPPVEEARVAESLKALTDLPTRHTLSPQAESAAAWIEGRLRSFGLEVDRFAFEFGGRTCHNVVATKGGAGSPDEFILIGAHYDSRMERIGDSGAPAPGADDNASGVAALLEVARVLAAVPTDRSIRFVAFSGEEQGLVGSRAYAARCRADGLKIAAMINLDMVGHPIDPGRRRVVVEHDPGLRTPDNDAGSRSWADRLLRAARRTRLEAVEGPIYGSDYIPFEAIGVPCVGLYDGADGQPFYHTGDDSPAVVDPAYCAEVARLVVGAVLESMPTN